MLTVIGVKPDAQAWKVPCPGNDGTEEDHTHEVYDPRDVLALAEAIEDPDTEASAASEAEGLACRMKGAFIPTLLGIWVADVSPN